MRSQVASLAVAQRNTNDGISMVQTAESALSNIGDSLSRMRELAVQSSSAVLQTAERTYLQSEFASVRSEIDRISTVTEFNGLGLVGAAVTTVNVQVGIAAVGTNQITVTLQKSGNVALAITASTIATATDALVAITALDAAIDTNNTSRAAFGAVQNRLSSALHNLEGYTENLVAAESRIRDVDFASETADMTRNSIFQQAGVSILAQANQSPQVALQLLS
jgi:flagellin